MRCAKATKDIQAAAIAKGVEEERLRQRQEQERLRIELERKKKRQAASERRNEVAVNVANRVAAIVDELWLAAGEGRYQFWVGKLAKVERKLLSDQGLSMRTISDELKLLNQDYKKIWSHVLLSDRYVEDKNTFLGWLASEMGLLYDADLDDVIGDEDEWNEPETSQQRSDVFNQITMDFALRYSLIAEPSHDGFLVTTKRDTLSGELLNDAIKQSAFRVKYFMEERYPLARRGSKIPVSEMLPDRARHGLLHRYRDWLTSLDLDGWTLETYLSPLASMTLATEDLPAEDHYFMRGVKKQCLKWCNHYLIDEAVKENEWVVSWWDGIFSDIQEKSGLAHQLAWLSSKDVQAALEEVEERIEGAASRGQSQVTIAFDDTLGTARLFATLMVKYVKRLGYKCEALPTLDKIRISWGKGAD